MVWGKVLRRMLRGGDGKVNNINICVACEIDVPIEMN